MLLDDAIGLVRVPPVTLDPALARELEERIADSASLAFRVALAVLRRREDAEDVAQEAFLRAQYRNVGTSIDYETTLLAGGTYRVELGVENSSVFSRSAEAASGKSAPSVNEPPMLRSFSVRLAPVLRDGQTVETVASTDPVTGEVMKIEVTLNVLK